MFNNNEGMVTPFSKHLQSLREVPKVDMPKVETKQPTSLMSDDMLTNPNYDSLELSKKAQLSQANASMERHKSNVEQFANTLAQGVQMGAISQQDAENQFSEFAKGLAEQEYPGYGKMMDKLNRDAAQGDEEIEKAPIQGTLSQPMMGEGTPPTMGEGTPALMGN